jgi:hypothetical protein
VTPKKWNQIPFNPKAGGVCTFVFFCATTYAILHRMRSCNASHVYRLAYFVLLLFLTVIFVRFEISTTKRS